MKTNYDYIKEFVKKHHYHNKVKVISSDKLTIDNIEQVLFDENDIPSGIKIEIQDIIYDIESDLPEDVFYRYLEFLDDNKLDVSYVYWMTKMDNQYKPMNIDNSESFRIKNLIYNSINNLKNKTWF